MTETHDRLPSRMLIGRDRLFYSGLVGNSMKPRRLGAIGIYAATETDMEIKIGDGPWQQRGIVALEPFTPHQLRTKSGHITNICLEPETIDQDEIHRIIAEINRCEDERLIRRILVARREITKISDAGGFSTREFDRYFLRQDLKPRSIDHRIRFIIDTLVDELQENTVSANACAKEIGISTSRFLHLFKDSTNISFRSQRMWKRARRFMDHVNGSDSLTDVALDLGYPDSSHFSHSIRACFGLQPRSIREGSRGMQICMGENYEMSGGYV